MDKKTQSTIFCLQETHLRTKDIHRLKVKGRKKYSKQVDIKKAGVAVLVSDKVDFKTEAIIRDKGHYIILNGVVQEEDITLVNIYIPYLEAPKYIRKILEDFKKETDSNTVIVGNLTPHCQQWVDLPNTNQQRYCGTK